MLGAFVFRCQYDIWEAKTETWLWAWNMAQRLSMKQGRPIFAQSSGCIQQRLSIPSSRYLFQSIECLLQSQNMIREVRIFEKVANRLKSSYESKGYIKFYSFHLSVTLSHQPRLISYYLTILIGLISENPFGADDMSIFEPWDKFSYVIPHKLIQLFMHWLHPILILKSFFYPFWLKLSR